MLSASGAQPSNEPPAPPRLAAVNSASATAAAAPVTAAGTKLGLNGVRQLLQSHFEQRTADSDESLVLQHIFGNQLATCISALSELFNNGSLGTISVLPFQNNFRNAICGALMDYHLPVPSFRNPTEPALPAFAAAPSVPNVQWLLLRLQIFSTQDPNPPVLVSGVYRGAPAIGALCRALLSHHMVSNCRGLWELPYTIASALVRHSKPQSHPRHYLCNIIQNKLSNQDINTHTQLMFYETYGVEKIHQFLQRAAVASLATSDMLLRRMQRFEALRVQRKLKKREDLRQKYADQENAHLNRVLHDKRFFQGGQGNFSEHMLFSAETLASHIQLTYNGEDEESINSQEEIEVWEQATREEEARQYQLISAANDAATAAATPVSQFSFRTSERKHVPTGDRVMYTLFLYFQKEMTPVLSVSGHYFKERLHTAFGFFVYLLEQWIGLHNMVELEAVQEGLVKLGPMRLRAYAKMLELAPVVQNFLSLLCLPRAPEDFEKHLLHCYAEGKEKHSELFRLYLSTGDLELPLEYLRLNGEMRRESDADCRVSRTGGEFVVAPLVSLLYLVSHFRANLFLWPLACLEEMKRATNNSCVAVRMNPSICRADVEHSLTILNRFYPNLALFYATFEHKDSGVAMQFCYNICDISPLCEQMRRDFITTISDGTYCYMLFSSAAAHRRYTDHSACYEANMRRSVKSLPFFPHMMRLFATTFTAPRDCRLPDEIGPDIKLFRTVMLNGGMPSLYDMESLALFVDTLYVQLSRCWNNRLHKVEGTMRRHLLPTSHPLFPQYRLLQPILARVSKSMKHYPFFKEEPTAEQAPSGFHHRDQFVEGVAYTAMGFLLLRTVHKMPTRVLRYMRDYLRREMENKTELFLRHRDLLLYLMHLDWLLKEQRFDNAYDYEDLFMRWWTLDEGAVVNYPIIASPRAMWIHGLHNHSEFFRSVIFREQYNKDCRAHIHVLFYKFFADPEVSEELAVLGLESFAYENELHIREFRMRHYRRLGADRNKARSEFEAAVASDENFKTIDDAYRFDLQKYSGCKEPPAGGDDAEHDNDMAFLASLQLRHDNETARDPLKTSYNHTRAFVQRVGRPVPARALALANGEREVYLPESCMDLHVGLESQQTKRQYEARLQRWERGLPPRKSHCDVRPMYLGIQQVLGPERMTTIREHYQRLFCGHNTKKPDEDLDLPVEMRIPLPEKMKVHYEIDGVVHKDDWQYFRLALDNDAPASSGVSFQPLCDFLRELEWMLYERPTDPAAAAAVPIKCPWKFDADAYLYYYHQNGQLYRSLPLGLEQVIAPEVDEHGNPLPDINTLRHDFIFPECRTWIIKRPNNNYGQPPNGSDKPRPYESQLIEQENGKPVVTVDSEMPQRTHELLFESDYRYQDRFSFLVDRMRIFEADRNKSVFIPEAYTRSLLEQPLAVLLQAELSKRGNELPNNPTRPVMKRPHAPPAPSMPNKKPTSLSASSYRPPPPAVATLAKRRKAELATTPSNNNNNTEPSPTTTTTTSPILTPPPRPATSTSTGKSKLEGSKSAASRIAHQQRPQRPSISGPPAPSLQELLRREMPTLNTYGSNRNILQEQ